MSIYDGVTSIILPGSVRHNAEASRIRMMELAQSALNVSRGDGPERFAYGVNAQRVTPQMVFAYLSASHFEGWFLLQVNYRTSESSSEDLLSAAFLVSDITDRGGMCMVVPCSFISFDEFVQADPASTPAAPDPNVQHAPMAPPAPGERAKEQA